MKNTSAVKRLVNILKQFTLDDIRFVEEKVDEQFKALQYLYNNLDTDSRKYFLPLIIANALVSYQLNTTGEQYWWEFAKYFSSKEINQENFLQLFRDFLLNSKGNKRYLNVKIRRLEKFSKHIETLKEREQYYYNNMSKLNDFLARVMNQKREAKTIVFAVKMFGYGARIKFNKFVLFPFDVAIPLDSRIQKLTSKLTDEDPIEFWFHISRETNIPPLHIDSLVWTAMGKTTSNFPHIGKLISLKKFVISLLND